MTVMKKILKLTKHLRVCLRVLMINAIVCSLIQNPFVNDAMAANTGFGAQDISNLANSALGVYSSYLGQKQQILQAQISAANNQRLMSQLSPTCVKADGTACYTTPAKNFPECTLPASMTNMPANVCENPTPEVNQISSMITYEAVAQGWMNYYDQMSNEASNSSYPVGLNCLADKKKALDSQLTEMVNSLQRLQDQLNKDKQTFRDNNAKLLADMNTANDELFGSGNSNNLKLKTQDFSKYFSSSCQSVIGKDALKAGPGVGLNGILQNLTSSNKSAADFNQNKNVIQDDVTRETSRIASTIGSMGVDDWFNANSNQINNTTGYPALSVAVAKQMTEFNVARSRITKELDAVGYKAPPMDSNFSVDLATFSATADDFFKKQYISDCVTGAAQGVAIPIDQILSSLKQSGTGNQGTATNDYRTALKKVLDSDASMDSKMAQIKDLESTYKDITVTYKDSTSSRISETPYNLLMKTEALCERKYTSDPTSVAGSNSGITQQAKVKRAKAAIQELKNLNDQFSAKISQAVNDQVLNCGGAGMKAGSDNCSEETLKPSSANFCIAHASVCANSILGCYSEANQQVQARKTKMENLAKNFNANVTAMINSSNQLFNQQKAAVTNITKLIQQRFPGTNFEIPANLFVATPAMSKDKYGVDMMGNGDLSSILDGPDSMPNKINGLKKMFQDQKVAADKAMDDYYNGQKEAMAKNKERWSELMGKCKSAVDNSSKALAKLNSEGQQNQAKQDADVIKFCKKYNSISQNPVGACGQAKDLADSANQIAARISGQAEGLVEQYANACDGYMNSKDSLSSVATACVFENPDKPTKSENAACKAAQASSGIDASSLPKRAKKLNLAALCGSGSSLNSESDFISAVSGKLSPADKTKLANVTSLSDATTKADGDADFTDNSFFDDISSVVDSKSSDKVCTQLNSIMTAKPVDAKVVLQDFQDKKAEQDAIIKTQQARSDNTASTAAAKKDADDKIEAARKEISRLKDLKDTQIADAEKQAKINNALANLSQIKNPDAPTGLASIKNDVQKIGQQTSGTPCDMQAGNTTAAKTLGLDLAAHDQQILGNKGRSQ